jgi:hypothetical protein
MDLAKDTEHSQEEEKACKRCFSQGNGPVVWVSLGQGGFVVREGGLFVVVCKHTFELYTVG